MTNQALLTALQVGLPNFPSEVIEEWLLPYAEKEGWPPALSDSEIPLGRWRYLLRATPLEKLKTLKWAKINEQISMHNFSDNAQEVLIQMVLGAVNGDLNIYSNGIKDLSKRFFRVIDYIKETGVLPKPPSLLFNDGKLEVLDGNHRVAALLYCRGNFKLPLDEALLQRTSPKQDFWVCSYLKE